VQTLPFDVHVSAAVFAALHPLQLDRSRSEAAQRRFQRNSSLENAAPAVRDAARVADPSTLRRWFRSLDNSNPPFSFLRRAIGDVSQWLAHGRIVQHRSLRLSWPTVVPFLQVLWPLRL
jgi:hypothetical protein